MDKLQVPALELHGAVARRRCSFVLRVFENLAATTPGSVLRLTRTHHPKNYAFQTLGGWIKPPQP